MEGKYNEKINQQLGIAKEMEKLLTNMKKDSASRRTQQYIQTRTTTLQNLYDDFIRIHKELILQLSPDDPYLTNNYQEKIEEKRAEIQSLLQKFEGELKIQDPIIKKQLIRFAMLQTYQDDMEGDIRPIECKEQELASAWKEIQSAHMDILCKDSEDITSYVTKYEVMKSEYQRVRNQLSKEGQHRRQVNKINLPLPNISVPIFAGNYEQWPTFHDVYNETVHSREDLSCTQKLQYLKSFLRGEASRLIQHLDTTASNYEAAWEIVQQRYSNERILFSKFTNRILNLPTTNWRIASSHKHVHDTINECMHAIGNLNIDVTTWSPLIAAIVINKMDSETKEAFDNAMDDQKSIPQLEEVLPFLERRFQTLEASKNMRKPEWNNRAPQNQRKMDTKIPVESYHIQKTRQCKVCKEDHTIKECPKFLEMTIYERNQVAKKNSLCMNCLSHSSSTKCFTRKRCHKCHQFHHTLLHFAEFKSKESAPKQASFKQEDITNGGQEMAISHMGRNTIKNGKTKVTLLATAYIDVRKMDGSYTTLRTLVDPGSEASFITQQAAQLLGTPRTKHRTEISGVGKTEAGISNWKINAEIRPRFSSSFKLIQELLIIPKITGTIPREEIRTTSHQWNDTILADPFYHKPGPIDILLGADAYALIIDEGNRKVDEGLVGVNTKIGYILLGSGETYSPKIKITSMISSIQEIGQQMEKFWELEEPETENKAKDDGECEKHFKNTCRRESNGSYTVRIPFNENKSSLGDTANKAIAQLYQLEKKFRKNQSLSEDYKEFMKEYITMGHMSPINQGQVTEGYYIPHQAVVRADKSTTKLRVVFNATCPSTTGLSLNDIMPAGPILQNDISDILLRFRTFQYALTADIEKMYRMIKLHPEDREMHRILWRFQETEPITVYELNTLTYGTKIAPYLAIRTLQQLAEDEKIAYPRAAQFILNNFYVDDALVGADSRTEAMQIRQELTEIMRRGGFNLRKWKGNMDPDPQTQDLALGDQGEKTLGIIWKTQLDTLQYHVQDNQRGTVSKRTILSKIASIYDPLGLLAPLVIVAKVLLQDIWKMKCTWDEKLPQSIEENWTKFTDNLQGINALSIPRWVQTSKTNAIELHGFSDASLLAYSAAIYIKAINPQNVVHVNLLTAKAKVAPLKTKRTIPQLELQGANLLSKLMKKVISALDMKEIPITCYTDSTIVLSWITNKQSKQQGAYITNRVNNIKQNIPGGQWRYVNTKDNPADLASRGTSVRRLQESIWFHGPEWLQRNEYIEQMEVPTPPASNMVDETRTVMTIQNEAENGEISASSWTKTKRSIAYCIRFIERCRKMKNHPAHLTPEELQHSEEVLYRMVQQDYFRMEIQDLSKTQALNKKSKLLSLNPFLDEDGILRVGGRLHHAKIPYNEKHPVIIPEKSKMANLIMEEAHKSTLHGGIQQTLAYSRRQCWIPKGKQRARQVVKNCIICTRFRASCSQQQMGNLPAARVQQSHPFTHTGIDYAGPIDLRVSKGRGTKSYKGYIALFICLATKAIHLEAVSDLTTKAFIAAFNRFTARRGLCTDMYSDNGTTFKGAKNELDRDLKAIIREDQIEQALAPKGIRWHWIPPSSPHFGGLWEAGVKSAKFHLKRIMGNSTLTYEEMATLLCQIEANLNSRPLIKLGDQPEDTPVLTPGHFLIGQALTQWPEPEAEPQTLTNRWRLLQKLKRDFWKQWSSEYLSRLQHRTKWHQSNQDLTKGDIVLIKQENIDPNNWPLAKVVEVHPGQDGLIRVVTVQTSNHKTFKRPITKICKLPVHQSQPVTKDTNEHSVEKRKPQNKILTALICIMILSTTTIASVQANHTTKILQPEIDVNKVEASDVLHHLRGLETDLSQRLSNERWRHLTHAISSSSVTTIIILGSLALGYFLWQSKICKASKTSGQQQEDNAVEMQPLSHSRHSNSAGQSNSEEHPIYADMVRTLRASRSEDTS